MESFQYQYPGDPLTTCITLTPAEFHVMFRDKKMRVVRDDGVIYDSGHIEEIICDSCNREIGRNGNNEDLIYLAHDWAYCKECANKWIIPYKI